MFSISPEFEANKLLNETCPAESTPLVVDEAIESAALAASVCWGKGNAFTASDCAGNAAEDDTAARVATGAAVTPGAEVTAVAATGTTARGAIRAAGAGVARGALRAGARGARGVRT
ncbi:hypothetical protein [Limnobacter sp.]|uniref:hypothetical protein n=1 Tax=Limnobacter sp. TaxID=2003368 RepID=UPI002FE1CCF8